MTKSAFLLLIALAASALGDFPPPPTLPPTSEPLVSSFCVARATRLPAVPVTPLLTSLQSVLSRPVPL
jgi:hypothetical protein